MRTFLLLIFFLIGVKAFSQKNSFDKFSHDTIQLINPRFDKTAGLILDNAIVYIEANFFKVKLSEERKGYKKNIRKRKRNQANSFDLKEVQNTLASLDSAYKFLVTQKTDTVHLSYKEFFSTSNFGYFISELIENNKCAVTDKNFVPQSYIIRQIGWKKNGNFSSGSRLYFLRGQESHFWSKWDWST